MQSPINVCFIDKNGEMPEANNASFITLSIY